MKRILIWLAAFMPFLSCFAGDGDKHITANVGIMAPYTLDATVGYEHPLAEKHTLEAYAEIGNHWQTPVCHMFWKDYFWDGGILYKYRIARFKNANLRVLGGVHCGLNRRNLFCGTELGFEYNYVFPNSWEFSIRQKNQINFIHGDVFRCGVMFGIKIPL